MNSCLSCNLFVTCNNSHKSHNYVCGNYEKRKIINTFSEFFDKSTDIDNKIITDITIDEKEYKKQELGLVKMLDGILKPDSLVPFDLKIDDRDLPEFPNFFTFCTSKDGADQSPFARQLAIATHVFGEFCPRCSHEKFNRISTVPKSYPAISFPEKVQFLEFGVCTRCKVTKSELIKTGELNFYSELAACIGQRGGKSALIGLMVPYIIHKYLKLQKPTEVFGLMKNSILVGTVAALTYGKAVELLWMPIHNVISNSKWFCVSEGTQILLADESEKSIESIKIGDKIKTLEGESTVSRVFDNGNKQVYSINLENGSSLEATKDHLVRCLSQDQKSLIWKKVSDITEDDYVILR